MKCEEHHLVIETKEDLDLFFEAIRDPLGEHSLMPITKYAVYTFATEELWQLYKARIDLL